MLQQELSEKDGKLKELRDQELALRQEKSKLEEARRELELDLQRKLDEAKKAIGDQIREAEAERFKMREAEFQKKIDDTLKANEDLRRKLEQGSQQLQGEVLELEIENLLRLKFPFDSIEPVPKGEFGGDAIQKVNSQTGQQAGSILWESKRTKNWSDGWLGKLREDQRTAKADIAVIVSQTLPKGVESFDVIDGIWVTNPRAAIPVATVLRHTLLQVNMARQASEGQQTKTEMVYQYLTGPRFRQRVEAKHAVIKVSALARPLINIVTKGFEVQWYDYAKLSIIVPLDFRPLYSPLKINVTKPIFIGARITINKMLNFKL